MQQVTDNKTIAKNTVFLYFRMLFTMLVSLYTSRVILQILGVDDYGIFQTVGGVVGMLSFLNGALSSGTSRFLTYEIGVGDLDKLRKTFSTIFIVHVILGVVILIIAETIGLWFIHNKLVIPEERIGAAIQAYHWSVFAAVVAITQVPYTSCIIAHERMKIYAYMSIIESVLRLSIVFLLPLTSFDKLSFYALLYFFINLVIALCYRIYCIRNFIESRVIKLWDKRILKGVLNYSSWNLLANASLALVNQGGLILINMFFNPAVVAAQTLANQVNMAANQFINSFRTAANPQIVKKYAIGDYNGSKRLLLDSTRYSFFLMLLIALPVVFIADTLLEIWLGEVPEYTSCFLRVTILGSLFSVFDTSFYTALYAKGQIKENALLSPFIYAFVFPITYLLYKCGCSPVSLSFVMTICIAIVGLIVKPILLIKFVNYKAPEIISVYKSCLFVTLYSIVAPLAVHMWLGISDSNKIVESITLLIVSVLSVSLSVWFKGLDGILRNLILTKLKVFLKNK